MNRYILPCFVLSNGLIMPIAILTKGVSITSKDCGTLPDSRLAACLHSTLATECSYVPLDSRPVESRQDLLNCFSLAKMSSKGCVMCESQHRSPATLWNHELGNIFSIILSFMEEYSTLESEFVFIISFGCLPSLLQ